MTREEILSRVQAVLNGEFALDPGRTLPDARLQDDLDLDSIDLVALAMRLEQETGLLLKEGRLHQLRTVEDVAAFVFDLQAPVASIGRPG